MPFTFKLSRRLAGIPAAMLAATLVVVACEFQRATEPTPGVKRVELLPVAVALQPDQTVTFTAVTFNQADDTIDVAVTWSATGGSITPMANSGSRHVGQYRSAVCGQFKVVAAAQPTGKADTANATVTCVVPPPVPVASVGVTPASASVNEGKTAQLTATLKDAAGNVLSGRVVTWTSSNTAAATVSASGLVTGEVAGSATITVASEGQSGMSAITILRVPVASVSVAPVAASVQAASTVQLTATPKDASGVPLSGRTTTWVSGNTAIATVNGSGLVSGVAAGVVTISATSEGQTGSGTVTVSSGSGGSPVFVGAGDIANCGRTGDEATAALLDAIPGTVFTAGDNAYVDGTAAEYANCYDPSWGRHKARTRPTPGNHEYNTPGGAGYYAYFGAAAGEPGKGYYAFDLGEWRILMLNSQVDVSAGSPQEQWLRADLAANPHQCTLAVFHYPYFTSGTRGRRTEMRAVWQALYDAGADVVISGHDHLYERFAPQTPAGAGDPDRGIRQFTAGMGGSGLYEFGTTTPNSEVRNNTAYGVLKLTLHPTSYAWEFVPVAGQTFTDRGSASCH